MHTAVARGLSICAENYLKAYKSIWLKEFFMFLFAPSPGVFGLKNAHKLGKYKVQPERQSH